MIARNHHFVPQCYLRGFTHGKNRQSQITVFDRERRKSFLTISRNIAAQRDFNRINMEGYDPNALELAYGEFESKLAPALVRIESARNINDKDDRDILLNFISLLVSRNPKEREKLNNTHETILKRTMEIVVSSEEMYNSQTKAAKKSGFLGAEDRVPYEKLKKFVEDDEYNIILDRERFIQSELQMNEAILPYLCARKWCIISSEDSTGFITSDYPVCLQWKKRSEKGYIFPPGFALKNTEVIFPISKKFLVVGTFEEDTKYKIGWDGSTAYYNSVIAAHSHKQIFAADKNLFYLTEQQTISRGIGIMDQSFFRKRS